MSFISDYVTPFLGKYHRWIEGSYLATQLQYKGGEDAGTNYIDKVDRYNIRKIQSCYDETVQSIKNPSFSSFFTDNLFRFLLNPFDRLIVAYQAYPSLKARFTKPGTFSHTFTEILNEGAIFGAFKGAVFNFAQLALVLYPSVYFANKSESKYATFLSSYLFLDALFYPVDTLKNILYADTLSKYSLKTVTNSTPFLRLYQGITYRLIFNVPFVSALYSSTQANNQKESLFWWGLTALLYPLNTQRVRAQLEGTAISTVTENTGRVFHSNYRGVLPFVILNGLIGYSLRPLFSADKVKEIEVGVRARLEETGYADYA